MSSFLKLNVYPSPKTGNSAPGSTGAPMAENAISRKVLSQMDAKKIEDACCSLDRAMSNLSFTAIFGERYSKRTLKSDTEDFNRKTVALAAVLKEIAAQNPEAKIFEFTPIISTSLNWQRIDVYRAGDENRFASLSIYPDNGHDSDGYTSTQFPIHYNYNVDLDKRKIFEGNVKEAIEGLKSAMTDILNYKDGKIQGSA